MEVIKRSNLCDFNFFMFRKVKRISYCQFAISLLLAFAYTEFLKTSCDKYGGGWFGVDDVKSEQWILQILIFPLLVEVAFFEILLRVTYYQTFLGIMIMISYNLSRYYQTFLALCFITTAVISMLHDDCDAPFIRDVSAVSGLLTWLYIFSAAQMLPKFGTKIMIFVKVFNVFKVFNSNRIFVKVFKRLSKLIIAYMPMLLGFSLSFGLILPEKKSFSRTLSRINNVVGMLLGELSLLDNFPNDEEENVSANCTAVANNTREANVTSDQIEKLRSWETSKYTAHLLFFFFCICASIVVFNVLTAFAIKDVEEVLSKAHKSKLLKKAEYITYLEASFLGR